MSTDTLAGEPHNRQHFTSGSVDREENAVGESFSLASDDIPELGRDISFEGLVFSRENSNSFMFGRERSQTNFTLDQDLPLVLSRENSQSLARERSTSDRIAEELGVNFSALIDGADVHDFLNDSADANAQGGHAPPYEHVPVSNGSASHRDGSSRMNIDSLIEPIAIDPAQDQTPHPAPSPHTNPGPGAPRSPQSKRGLHVRGRPEMQQTARDGAVHWSNMVKSVRRAWSARAAQSPEFHNEYQGQIDLSLSRIKSKQECLLRTLQLAAADGLITPAEFGAGVFFGWRRFDVVPARAAEFRRALEGLFAVGFHEGTLKEMFRRAGLVPERWQWALGWAGHAPWLFHAHKSRDASHRHPQ